MKPVPKLDESGSGQMVLEKVKITYYYRKQCGMACFCSLKKAVSGTESCLNPIKDFI